MFHYVKKLILPTTCMISGVIGVKNATNYCERVALKKAVVEAESLIREIQDKNGCPGISVAVSVNGPVVWEQGFGYSDIENQVPCGPDTVMKIASLSKPITTAILARSIQQGLLKWDDSVARYVPYWPQKYWKDEKVDICVNQLASHLSGIRDYKKIAKHAKASDDDQEFSFQEYYIKRRFRSTEESVKLFKDDPLISRPGEKFHYTTHGFTLLAAVLEGATQSTFPKLVRQFFHEAGMENSHLDKKNKIIYGRAKYYCKNRTGDIINAPFTESSFKWAGAGMLSTAPDLVRFGNAMLYSYHNTDGLLQPETVAALWSPVHKTSVSWHRDGRYGMGWQVIPLEGKSLKCQRNPPKDNVPVHDVSKLANTSVTSDVVGEKSLQYPYRSLKDKANGDKAGHDRALNLPGVFVVGHTGGTIGASAALIILPLSGELTDVTNRQQETDDFISVNRNMDSSETGKQTKQEKIGVRGEINIRENGREKVTVNRNSDCASKKDIYFHGQEEIKQKQNDVSKDRNEDTKDFTVDKTLDTDGHDNQGNSQSHAFTGQDIQLHNLQEIKERCPKGVVVAILCNMQGVSLGPVAVEIAHKFRKAI